MTSSPHPAPPRAEDAAAELEQLLAVEHALAAILAEHPGRSELLTAILETATRVPGIDGGGLYWEDADGGYSVVRHRGLSDRFIELVGHVAPEDPRTAIVRAGKLVTILPDAAPGAQGSEVLTGLASEGIDVLVVLPILVNGRAVACLNLASRTTHTIPRRTLSALETLTRTFTRALERLEVQEQLQAERENFAELFDTIGDYLFVITYDGTILHYNKAVSERLGWGARLLGRPVLEVHPEDRHGEARAVVREVMGGRRDGCEIELLAADGRVVPVETRVKEGTWNGKPVLIGISRDLSAQRAREQELALERRLRDSIIAAIPALFFAFDESLRLVFWNLRFAEAAECTDAELRTLDTRLLFDPADRALVAERITEVFESGASSIELTLHGRRGKRTPCLFDGVMVELEGRKLLVGTGLDITERKRMEDALRESQAFLRLLLETLPARVFWKDRSCRYLGSNRTFARDAGVPSPEALVGRVDTELAWKAHALEYVHDDQEVMRSGAPKLAFEEPVFTSAGDARWIRTSKVPLRSAGGEVIGLLGMYEDITEQRELREALRRRDRYQSALLDNFPMMVWLKDGDGRFLAVNQPFADACGAPSPADVVGKTDPEVWPEPLARAYVLDDQEVQRSGRPKIAEETVLVRGEPVWMEAYKSPVTIDGKTIGTVGFAADITKRKEREQADRYQREATELKYGVSRAMQSARASFAERVDRALATFQGLPGLLPGANATLILARRDGPGGTEHYGAGLWADAPPPTAGREVECTLCCPTPGVAHGHYVVPVMHGEERLGTLILDTEPAPPTHPARMDALRSIGESFAQALLNERAAQLLRDATAHAESASVAKSQFLAMMSHEIRTPMNGILGTAQLLAASGQSDEERREHVATMLACGETLLSLLDDILDLSKIEAGKLVLEQAPVEPALLVLESAHLFDEAARKKGLALHATWHGASARYLADGVRLRQMIANLVNNAVKFTAEGEIRVEGRELSRDASTALLELSVTDTGIGVPESRRAALFKPFSQVDGSTTRRFGGSGLGLSIVKSLAEEMGGRVGVESRAGQGSRFWFEVRVGLAEVSATPAAPLRAPTVALPEGLTLRPSSVLVVEDNAVNRMVIERMLKKLGMTVWSVEDGRRAVERVTAGEPTDLVLMDCQMPDMDGFEATELIRRWESHRGAPRVPIIALTAAAYDDDRRRCLVSGMDDFLTKPIHGATLVETLARWLPAGGLATDAVVP